MGRNPPMLNTKSGLSQEIESLRSRVADLERERETVEAERRERLRGEERYRVVSDATGQVIYDCDVPTRHIEWAGRVEDITGYTREEFNQLGVPGWRERLHPEDRTRVEANLDAAMRYKTQFHCEYRFRKKDGSYRFFEDNGSYLYDDSGQAARMLGSMKDITERRDLELQLQQAAKMEAIGQLAGGVAHDFNNLLTCIRGYSEVLLQSVKPLDPIRQDIEEIHKAADRAAALTQQLLTFSRKQIIAPEVINLNTVVNEASKMLGRLIGENIDLTLNLDGQLGLVRADPQQIDQILVNLAVNARDAMPGGGKLVIATENVEFADEFCRAHPEAKPGPHVMLSVSDTGCGMDHRIQSRIFEPFFTTKPKGKGTGLGLSTVYGIVQQNHGVICVSSEPGAGATFRICLPRVSEKEIGVSRPKRLSADLRGTETVLLVEDDEVVGNLAAKVLNRRGYKVIRSTSPTDALPLFERHKDEVRLLLTDIVMPGMDGKELFARLQAMRVDLRVIFMSGYTEDIIAHHGVLEEGINFVQKPFTIDELCQAVRRVLDQA
jgi:PAS domain S-box-containing protein